MTSDEGAAAQWILPNTDVYQTERYGANEGFKYLLPLNKDGLYALVLKFSEVYFTEPGQKIFDIKLGNEAIVQDLDIFAKVESRGMPYDEFIEFMVQGQKVYVQVKALISFVLIVVYLGPRNPKCIEEWKACC